MTLPKVAVLLATYNGAAHCETQLTSILWQRGVEVCIYARDDGSRDATPAILTDYAARHPGRVVVVDVRGVPTGSANANFLTLLAQVDLSAHDHVAFADQDDVWTPDKLRRAVERMEQEGAEAYSSDLIAYDTAKNAAWMLYKTGRSVDLDYLFQGGSAGCTYVLSRRAGALAVKVLADAPAFCPGASHDWILYAICRSRGVAWVRDTASEILYRQHGGNEYGAQRGWRDIAGKLRLTQSRWYRDHILWLRHIVPGSPDERNVLERIARGRLRDRLWLVRQAARFRRNPRHVAQLRAAILLGMI